MAKPNSVTTKVRRYLSDKLDPCPDMGEGWCVNCSLNGGKTAVISATGLRGHLEQHPPDERLMVYTSIRTEDPT